MGGTCAKLSFLLVSAATMLMAAESDNLLTNGGFETSGTGWTLDVSDSAAATRIVDTISGTAKEGKGFQRITVTKATSENWHVQLKDPLWTAKKNYKYHFSMWARSDSARSAQISVYGGPKGKDSYRTSTSISLTSEWQQFHQMFTADTAGSGIINFAIVCGFSTGVYDIDGVVITESESNDGNMYANGDFEANGAGWNLYIEPNKEPQGAATISYPIDSAQSGSKFCRVNVTGLPGESWEIQLQDGSWTCELGAEYVFTFYAKSNAESPSVQVAAQSGSSRGYKYMDGLSFSITNEWAQYIYTYIASDIAGPDSLSFNIYLGYTLGTYDIDNVSLTKTPTSTRKSHFTTNKAAQNFTIIPYSKQLQFSFNANSSINRIDILDMQGRLFYSKLSDGNLGRSFNLPRPPSGTYIVKVNADKTEQRQKIVLP